MNFIDDGGTPGWRATHNPTFSQRLAAIPFWKKWLFMLGWGFVGPVVLIVYATIFYFIFRPAPGDLGMDWVVAGSAFVFTILTFVTAVRKKLGYGPRKGK